MKIEYDSSASKTGIDFYLYMDLSCMKDEDFNSTNWGAWYVYGKEIPRSKDKTQVLVYRRWIREAYVRTVRDLVNEINLRDNLLSVTIMGFDPYRMTGLSNDRELLMNCINPMEFDVSKEFDGKIKVNTSGGNSIFRFNPYEEIYRSAAENKKGYPCRKAVGIVIVQSTACLFKGTEDRDKVVQCVRECAKEGIEIVTIGIRESSVEWDKLIKPEEVKLLSTDNQFSVVRDYAGVLRLLKEIAHKGGSRDDFSSSKEKQQYQRKGNAYIKYEQEFKMFEAQYKNYPEIKSRRLSIKELDKKRNDLISNNKEGHFSWGWILGTGFPGIFLFFILFMGGQIADNRDVGSLLMSFSTAVTGIMFFVILFAIIDDVQHFILISLFGASFIGAIFLLVLMKVADKIPYIYENFYRQIQVAAMVLLAVTAFFIVKKIICYNRIRERKREIMKLNGNIHDNFHEIDDIISSVYRGIYDKYEEAGSERESVANVRERLGKRIRVEEGW